MLHSDVNRTGDNKTKTDAGRCHVLIHWNNNGSTDSVSTPFDI